MDLLKYTELGGMFVISLALIELVKYLINRSKPTGFNGSTKAILHELETQNSNHLTHIQNGIEVGFDKICEVQQRCADRICEKLDRIIESNGEIKGRLSK
jgi:hypothetical protein